MTSAPLTITTSLTASAAADKILRTAWVVQYETSVLNLFDLFSYKTDERVVDFKSVQTAPNHFTLTAAPKTWGEKDADHAWRAPVINIEMETTTAGTLLNIDYVYDPWPYRRLGLWALVWVLLLAFALYAYDLNYGFGFLTAVVVGVGGIAWVLATLSSVQANWSRIEKSMNLLLRDTFAH